MSTSAPQITAIFAHPVATVGFLGVLVWLSISDWRTHRLPDRIVLPTLWLGLIVNAVDESFASPSDAILGCVAGYGTLWTISATYELLRGGVAFGGGDLKLAAMIGAWLGIASIPAALFVAFLSGTCAVAPAIVRRQLRFSQAIPFGPALAFGGSVALVTGPTLDGWFVP